MRGNVTRWCPQITILEEKGEPKQRIKLTSSIYHPNNLPSGQTNSQDIVDQMLYFAFVVMDRCFLWQCQAFLCPFSWLACKTCAKWYVWTGHRLILSYFYANYMLIWSIHVTIFMLMYGLESCQWFAFQHSFYFLFFIIRFSWV